MTIIPLLLLPALATQAQIDVSASVTDNYARPVPGAVIQFESSTSTDSMTASTAGWASGVSMDSGDVVIATLAEHRTRQGLLLGQTFAHAVSDSSGSTSSSFQQLCFFSQPVAESTHISHKDTFVPGSGDFAWEWDAYPIQGGETKFEVTPEIAYLGAARVIEALEDFYDVSFPQADYKLGLDIVMAAECDLGESGIVFRINCLDRGFIASPDVTGLILTDYNDRATGAPPIISSPFHVGVSGWDSNTQVCEVQIVGKLSKGHNLILLSDGPASGYQAAVHIPGDAALIADTSAPEFREPSARVAAIGSRSIAPAGASMTGPRTVRFGGNPDCNDSGPPEPKDAEEWHCGSLENPGEPEPVTESGSCGGWNPTGPCTCGPSTNLKIGPPINGTGGDNLTVTIEASWTVTLSGGLEFEMFGLEGSFSASTSGTLTASTSVNVVTNDGDHGCGESKQIWLSLMDKGCFWVRNYTKHKYVKNEDCGAHPQQGCICNCYHWVQDGADCEGEATAETHRVHYKIITTTCNRVGC
jgi:hypothetical protein